MSTETLKVTALAPWFGSNRMLAPHVGRLLDGCEWVGVPFMGGGSELAHIRCRTGVANDRHHHVIVLAAVASHPRMGPKLYRRLRRWVFHPIALDAAQRRCREREAWSGVVDGSRDDDSLVQWAEDYFVCCWMSRNGTAGTRGEFNAGLSVRWNASGGDSVVRFQNAVRGLVEWRRILSRWTFECLDCFEFLKKCKDAEGHAIYADPPFPGPGDGYRHRFSPDQHERLAGVLSSYRLTRVVCRFYEVEAIRTLYPEGRWRWIRLTGRKQTNDDAPEVLIVNAATPGVGDQLF